MRPDDEGKQLLDVELEELGLSARAQDRIYRVARTVADLEGSESIKAAYFVESISHRSLDSKSWRR
jgi:magnesium chelatase family protein